MERREFNQSPLESGNTSGHHFQNSNGQVHPRPSLSRVHFGEPSFTLPAMNLPTSTPTGPPFGGANTIPRRLQSSEEDTQMMTPPPSPRMSLAAAGVKTLEPRPPFQGRAPHLCFCGQIPQMYPYGNFSYGHYANHRPFPRLPISQFLNSPPTGFIDTAPISTTPPTPTVNTRRPTTQTQTSSSNPTSTMTGNLPTRFRPSICSSATSSTTISPATCSIEEERNHLLNTLYHTCLNATSTYLRLTYPSPRGKRVARPRRHHPYASPPSHNIHGRRHQQQLVPSPPLLSLGSTGVQRTRLKTQQAQAPTLLDNISKISARLWRKARRDPVAPRRAEGEAVVEMRDLYAWGEVVAGCFEDQGGAIAAFGKGEGQGGRCMSEDGEMESVTEVGDGVKLDEGIGQEFAGEKVARCAMRICEWVDDVLAWDCCESIRVELRGLVEKGGGSEGEFEHVS